MKIWFLFIYSVIRFVIFSPCQWLNRVNQNFDLKYNCAYNFGNDQVCGKYIPNLSVKTKHLRDLIKKHTEIVGNHEHENELKVLTVSLI